MTKECGSCSLCCKLLPVDALSKPAGKWCNFCDAGNLGCKTYQLRPKQCREFSCGWLTNQDLGPEWKPDVAKFFLASDHNDRCMTIHCDVKHPTAWKRAPYHDILRKISVFQLTNNQLLMVVCGNRRTLVLPDQEIDIGTRNDRFSWTITQSGTAANPHFDVKMTPENSTTAAA